MSGIQDTRNEHSELKTTPKRKGASTVGIGLSDMNQQFCSTMFGITFGSSDLVKLAPKIAFSDFKKFIFFSALQTTNGQQTWPW